MFERILVALDGSGLSEQVIEILDRVELKPEAMVVMAHVLVNSSADPETEADRPHAETTTIPHQQMEKLQAYQSRLPCKSQIELVVGDPAEEILRLANIHQVDLIVMGSRGLTGIDRVLQGSVSSEVLQLAPCSVFVVKHN